MGTAAQEGLFSPVKRRSFSTWRSPNLAAPKELQGAEALLCAPVFAGAPCLQPRSGASMCHSLWWQKRLLDTTPLSGEGEAAEQKLKCGSRALLPSKCDGVTPDWARRWAWPMAPGPAACSAARKHLALFGVVLSTGASVLSHDLLVASLRLAPWVASLCNEE